MCDNRRTGLLSKVSDKHHTAPHAGVGGIGDHQAPDRHGGGRLPGSGRIPHGHHLSGELCNSLHMQDAHEIYLKDTLLQWLAQDF
jgi:hypothetical protein